MSIRAVADDHLNALRPQGTRGADDMAEHGFAGDRMQHLGQCRAHASALAGSENDDIKRHR